MINKLGWNPKLVVILGGGIALLGFFIASFMKSFWGFTFFYGFLSGIGCGINYFVPVVCNWEHFPERKGLMTGIMVGSYGIGSAIWT